MQSSQAGAPESPSFALVDAPSGTSVWALQGDLREPLFGVPTQPDVPRDFKALLGGRRDRLVLVLGARARAGRVLLWDGHGITAMPNPSGLGAASVRWQVSDDGSVLAMGPSDATLAGSPRLAYLPAGKADWRYVALPGGYAITAADSSPSTGLIVAGTKEGSRAGTYETMLARWSETGISEIWTQTMPYRPLFSRRLDWRGTRIDQLHVRSSLWHLGQYHGIAWGDEDTDCFAFDPDRHTSAKVFIACDLIAGCGSLAGGGDAAFVTHGGLLHWVERGGASWQVRDLRDPLADAGAVDASTHYIQSARLRGSSLLVLVSERTISGRPANGALYLSRDLGASFTPMAWPAEHIVVRAIDSGAPTFTEPYPVGENNSL